MWAAGAALVIFSLMGLFIYDIENTHDEEMSPEQTVSQTGSSSSQSQRFSIPLIDAASDDKLFAIFKEASEAQDLEKMVLSSNLLIAKQAAWKYRGYAYIFRAHYWYEKKNLKRAEDCLRPVVEQTEDTELRDVAQGLMLALQTKAMSLQE